MTYIPKAPPPSYPPLTPGTKGRPECKQEGEKWKTSLLVWTWPKVFYLGRIGCEGGVLVSVYAHGPILTCLDGISVPIAAQSQQLFSKAFSLAPHT